MYYIHEIFYSLQGEGTNAGKPVVFIRFAGCNLNCGFCDTPRVKGKLMTANQILKYTKLVAPKCKWVIFTGGEPLLQLDTQIIDTFSEYWKGLETNGTRTIPAGLDYVTVSPKGQLCEGNQQRSINELRYPIKHNDQCPPVEYHAEHRYLSPIFDGLDLNLQNLQWAIKLCKQNPVFSLSVQQHKLWRIR